MNAEKKAEALTVIDTVLMPQLRAVKVTLDWLEQMVGGHSYMFDREASGGVDRLIDVLGPGGQARESIAELHPD